MLRLGGFLALLVIALGATAQTRERALTAASVPNQSELRHALVIGNGAYTHGPLKNPVNDARAMAKALAAAGFNVRLLEDGSHVAMQRVVRLWGNDIAKGGVGLFYYAGHGLQVKGRNYLVPVNAEIDQEDEIEFGTLDVNLVLAKVDSAKNALNIVILDACRNNPFARSFRSASRGLAQMDAPTGTFIAFATAPGSVASDGGGVNGVYTEHLLKEMSRPGVPIEQMFKQVRIGVIADTKGQQIPWESSSMRGDFSFRAAVPVAAGAAAVSLADMERMIQAALDKQRAMFEAQGMKAQPAPAPKPAAPDQREKELKAAAEKAAAEKDRTEKLQVASIAPSSVASALGGRLPHQGDTWTYRLTEPDRRVGPKQRAFVATVSAASEAGILEQFKVDGDPASQWVHTSSAQIFPAGVSIFSPYMAAFRDLSPGTKIGDVTIVERECNGRYACDASASVVGEEVVKVPAGSFKAVKVRVVHTWRASGSTGGIAANTGMMGGRILTIWYVPELKRAARIQSRINVGDMPPVETDFDLELVSYQLK